MKNPASAVTGDQNGPGYEYDQDLEELTEAVRENMLADDFYIEAPYYEASPYPHGILRVTETSSGDNWVIEVRRGDH